MNIEIIEQPIRFHLYGVRGGVENKQYAQVGMRLMNEMWPQVKGAGLSTTGINHWVYLPKDEMFVGVEVRGPHPTPIPARLESLAFELRRYLKHVHVGPYETLPEKWQELHAELAARGETLGWPALEVYDHHSDDPVQCKTTILIGLAKRPS